MTLLLQDGYAVVASDGPGEYPVITESRAGNDALGVVVAPGTVAYVTTGGPIPDGTDAVVQVEDTEQVPAGADGSKRVRILVRAAEGQDIRNVVCSVWSLLGYLTTFCAVILCFYLLCCRISLLEATFLLQCC